YNIVTDALNTGLYAYLQPVATCFIFENSQFATNYFKSLQQLDSFHAANPDSRLGKKLVYLIFDFISSIVNQNIETADKEFIDAIYKNTWKACRNFILPMNPQRTELDFAVTASLKMLDIPVRTQKRNKFFRKSS
ncbi:MAG: polynucleotide adenylyltransferase PcnB, partial [Spirochaetales bacterium]